MIDRFGLIFNVLDEAQGETRISKRLHGCDRAALENLQLWSVYMLTVCFVWMMKLVRNVVDIELKPSNQRHAVIWRIINVDPTSRCNRASVENSRLHTFVIVAAIIRGTKDHRIHCSAINGNESISK